MTTTMTQCQRDRIRDHWEQFSAGEKAAYISVNRADDAAHRFAITEQPHLLMTIFTLTLQGDKDTLKLALEDIVKEAERAAKRFLDDQDDAAFENYLNQLNEPDC